MKRSHLLNCIAPFLTIALPLGLSAAVVGPYIPDANTLQLWSFDESAGSTTAANDVAGYALSAVNVLNTTTGTNSSILGATGYFGNAADLSGATNAGLMVGTGLNLVTPSDIGINDAFTLEAFVNISSITTANQEIISMESDSSSRPFQFVITAAGNLRFHPISGGDGALKEFAIPTIGNDAFVPDEWFHVAVTYNGNAGEADNLNFYWTAVDLTKTQANLIGSATMTADLDTGATRFVVGNEGRKSGNENLLGLIDEVRISNIARGAGEFAVPEPSTYALIMGIGAFALMIVRRRNLK